MKKKKRKTTFREAELLCFVCCHQQVKKKRKKNENKKQIWAQETRVRDRTIVTKEESGHTSHKRNWVFVFSFHMVVYRSHHHLPEAP